MSEPQMEHRTVPRSIRAWDVVVDGVVVAVSASDLHGLPSHALILARPYEWPRVEIGEGVTD